MNLVKHVLIAMLLAAPVSAFADHTQTSKAGKSSSPDRFDSAMIRKYDQNKSGQLDANEIDRMYREEESDMRAQPKYYDRNRNDTTEGLPGDRTTGTSRSAGSSASDPSRVERDRGSTLSGQGQRTGSSIPRSGTGSDTSTGQGATGTGSR